MAEDKGKKPKIDLKARLGKAGGGGAAAGAVPLPVPGQQPGEAPAPGDSSPGVPAPPPAAARPVGIAPPAGLSPGIPPPPFAQPKKEAPAPPPKQSAAQQTIKVEIGEEVHAEHRKMIKKTILYATLTFVVGMGVGYSVGGQKEKADRGKQAVAGAAALAKDVKTANDSITDLNNKLTEAMEQLQKKEYPAKLASDLGGINVPFDATNLEGKSVGSLPAKVLRTLLNYTTAVQDLNKTKDSLKNLVGALQPQVEKVWAEEKEPVVTYSVAFRADGKGTVAELVTNKEPFIFGKDWPGSYTITKLERGKPSEKKASRWVKGDLTGGDPVVIPIDPPTAAGFGGQEIMFKLAKAMRDVREVMEGVKDPTGQNEKAGLIQTGDDLAAELFKIGLAK